MLFSNFTFTRTVEGHSSPHSVALPIWFMLLGFSLPYVRAGTKTTGKAAHWLALSGSSSASLLIQPRASCHHPREHTFLFQTTLSTIPYNHDRLLV